MGTMETMETILTEEALTDALCALKRALEVFASAASQNITFINLESLLHHAGGGELPALLARVEPFIPLAITAANLERLLSAAADNDEGTLRALEDAFVYDSKIRFINAVFMAQTAPAWEEILDACRAVRAYKAQSRVFV